jgi:hypothetical protein
LVELQLSNNKNVVCVSGGLAAISVFEMAVIYQVNDYDVEKDLYTVTVSKAGEQRSDELHQTEILALPFGKRELKKFKTQPVPTSTNASTTPLLNTPDANWPFDVTGEPIVTVDLKKQLMRNFLDATSASALSLRVCAVCDGEKLQSKGCTMPIANIPNAHVLHQNDEPCLYVGDIDADGKAFLCRTCELSLNKGKPPPCSIYNIQLGELPDELKGLTFPEMMLISPVMCKSYVLKLVSFAGPDAAQRAVKGNCIAFMSDIQSVVKQVLLSKLLLVEVQPPNRLYFFFG